MSDLTPSALALNQATSGATANSVQLRENRYEPSTGHFVVNEPAGNIRGEDREAILASLYEERSRILSAKRLRQTSANDEEYLSELNQYIDEREAAENLPREKDAVWAKLDALADTLLAARVELSRTKK